MLRMKKCIVFLLLLILFVAAVTNEAKACGVHTSATQSMQESSCCGKVESAQISSQKGDSCGKHKDMGSSCPCNHERKGGCHCPGCGTVCHSVTGFILESVPSPTFLSLSASLQKLAYYFADHLPEAVYFPIWQPPKLDVYCLVSPKSV